MFPDTSPHTAIACLFAPLAAPSNLRKDLDFPKRVVYSKISLIRLYECEEKVGMELSAL